MKDDDLCAELVRLSDPNIEGRCGYMYLDNAKPPKGPNVTTGVGFLLASITDAQALPWVTMTGSDAELAAPSQIAAEFLRVKSMPSGLAARAYRGSLVLMPADIDAEGLRRLRAMAEGLQHEFPGFESFPDPVQQCLLDLRWNNGSLMGWRNLRNACNSVPPDWQTARDECTVANPDNLKLRAARNAWRQSCFTSVIDQA